MSRIETSLSRALHLKYPLIVAPMAGGPSTVELVIASSQAGVLGSVGAAYFNSEAIKDTAQRIRVKTPKPFAINLFIPSQQQKISSEQLRNAIESTKKFRDELNLPMPELNPPYEEDFDRQLEAVFSLQPAALSFVFGLLPPEAIQEARKLGILTVGTATTLDEAMALEASGIDAIVLQGVEAGGHRGIFDSTANDPQIKTLELLRLTKQKIKLPLIAAGGIMTAQDIKNVLQAGAEAVQMGTAFLATKEAGTSVPYRKKLLESAVRETRTTRAFSGRLARGIINRFMEAMDANPNAILPFPQQNKFTRDLRKASVEAGSADFLSLWCGAGKGNLWTASAADLIENLFSS